MEEGEVKVSQVTGKQHVRFLGLAWILAGIIFLVGLGIGNMDSDYRYWVQTSWSVTAAEWVFILVYILFGRSLHSLAGRVARSSRLVMQVSMLWMLVVLVSYFLSDYYSAGNLLALTRLIETMTHFLFFVVVWDFASEFPSVRRYALWSIVATVLVSTLYYLFAMLDQPYGGGLHLAGYAWHHVGLNGNIRRVGYEIEVALVLLLALAGSSPTRYRVFGWALCAGWLSFLIVLGGRASLLGVLVAMALYLLYRKGWKPFLKVFASLMAIALFFLMAFHFHDAYLSKMLDRTLLASSLESVTSGRTDVWSMLAENLHNHWILGTGPRAISSISAEDRGSSMRTTSFCSFLASGE